MYLLVFSPANPPTWWPPVPAAWPADLNAWIVARVSHRPGPDPRPGGRGPWPADLVPGAAGRALVAVDLVPGAGARVCVCVTWWPVFVYLDTNTQDRATWCATWCATWWPSTWCRGPWSALPGALPGGQVAASPWRVARGPRPPGPQKTGRVAGCAGISPFSHGQWCVKQFLGPAIKGPLSLQTDFACNLFVFVEQSVS